jgi:hypothetical protein
MQISGAQGTLSMLGQAAASVAQTPGSFGLSSATSADPASSNQSSSSKTAKSAALPGVNSGAVQFGSQTFDALLGAQAGQFSLTKS